MNPLEKKIIFPEKVCPVSGLRIRQLDEWKSIPMGETFHCGYLLLGSKTLVIRGQGYADLEAEIASVTYGNELVRNHLNPPSKYLMIQDWREYRNASGKARDYFIQSTIVNDTALKGIIFCNATHGQELSILLGHKLGILKKEIRICRSYDEAVIIAARYEQLGQIPEVKKTLLGRFRRRNRAYSNNIFKSPFRICWSTFKVFDWTSRKPRPSSYHIDSDHPLLPIFDALTLIKSQLDKTTNERNQYMNQLLEHQEALEEELEMRTRKIQEGEQYFSRILEYSPVSIALMDKSCCITYINRQAEECFGYSLEVIKENHLSDSFFSMIEQSGYDRIKDQLKTLLPPPLEPGSLGPIEVSLPANNGSTHITEITFTSIEEGYLISIVDITKRKKAEDELFTLSVTDQMTGFYNRRHFQVCMDKEFLRSKRYGRPLTLIIFDVDLFKSINDEYGHPAGDSVLRHLADIARTCFRSTDLLFRIGGEEFAVLLPETSEDLGLRAAERFRNTVEKNSTLYEDMLISRTVSLGIATTQSNDDTVQDFFKKTDIALYRAKQSGRNRSEVAVSASK